MSVRPRLLSRFLETNFSLDEKGRISITNEKRVSFKTRKLASVVELFHRYGSNLTGEHFWLWYMEKPRDADECLARRDFEQIVWIFTRVEFPKLTKDERFGRDRVKQRWEGDFPDNPDEYWTHQYILETFRSNKR